MVNKEIIEFMCRSLPKQRGGETYDYIMVRESPLTLSDSLLGAITIKGRGGKMPYEEIALSIKDHEFLSCAKEYVFLSKIEFKVKPEGVVFKCKAHLGGCYGYWGEEPAPKNICATLSNEKFKGLIERFNHLLLKRERDFDYFNQEETIKYFGTGITKWKGGY